MGGSPVRAGRGESMTISMLQHLPLSYAYLCQDCNSIGNCAEQCPACASHALMGLSTVLNRKEIAEAAPITVLTPAGFERRITMAA
jgi:ferredoxin